MNAVAKWAVEEFASGFASSVEGMAFVRLEVRSELLAALPAASFPMFRWKQPFAGLAGEVYGMVAESDVLAIGQFIMVAAGVEDSSPDELKATFQECWGQAFSVLARAMTGRLQREVTVASGGEARAVPDATWGK